MTELLKTAVAEVSKRTATQQNVIASLILAELADDEKWDTVFAASQDKLAKLANKVRDDIKKGRVKKMGFDFMPVLGFTYVKRL